MRVLTRWTNPRYMDYMNIRKFEMHIPTGRPRGRPPGSKNKRTAALKQAVAAAADRLEAEIPEAFVGDAHAFLVSIYKDPKHPIELRVDAAAKAIRYEKPALAAVQMTTTRRRSLADYSTAELLDLAFPEGDADNPPVSGENNLSNAARRH